ncbi:hypothetical protein J437_LFUL017862 [Ladona fulva]|uniref:Uncharacterized protein n=1 Tax=Ladona fulva TaxID=123851 RepID=A0A8K0KP61_LADFU|nr:hypothetical protein J437_LFUL017862 [Ladona fulva]
MFQRVRIKASEVTNEDVVHQVSQIHQVHLPLIEEEYHITTMKSITIALFLAVAVAAVNAQLKTVIPIVQQDEVRDASGQFTLTYVSGDGTRLSETGKLVPNDEGDGHVLVKEGTYTFTAPEGKTYTVRYVADKNGFQPVGDHLPVAPVA